MVRERNSERAGALACWRQGLLARGRADVQICWRACARRPSGPTDREVVELLGLGVANKGSLDMRRPPAEHVEHVKTKLSDLLKVNGDSVLERLKQESRDVNETFSVTTFDRCGREGF